MSAPLRRCFTQHMCRSMAYSGDPILAEELLFKPEHSIIDQSLHSRMGATTTNGDGFGIGWYGEGVEPLEPEGSCGPNPHTAAFRPYSGLDRYASTALQLPSIPA